MRRARRLAVGGACSAWLLACRPSEDDIDDLLTASFSSGTGTQSESSTSADDVADSSGATTANSGDGSGTGGATPFAIELPADKVPYCVTAGETLLDYVVPGSGDGTSITCDPETGNGAGVLPDGVSIDPDTCEIVGEPPADRYGTWAVIVKATQSGADAWVPYCITQDQPPGDATIEVFASTTREMDVALLPLRGTFDTTSPFSVGAAGDPVFRVIAPALCADGCVYGYQYHVGASPFDESATPVTDPMVFEEGGVPIGLSHGTSFTGPGNGDDIIAFGSRPWVSTLELDYCLAVDPVDCMDAASIEANTVARFAYSVVMTPE